VSKDGTRSIFFELNGEPRQVSVKDLSVDTEDADIVLADPGNDKHVGAPMPGKILKMNVSVGDEVEAGDTLFVTEAMKMETNVRAKTDGVVKEILLGEGAQVQQDVLIIVLD
jgi:pyruvate carboxylase